MAKLFISYAHADSDLVTQVSKELQEAGHEVWIDTHGIQGGSLWSGEIARAIIGCEVLVLFISPRSVRSDYVRREVDIAFDEKRRILPVMLEKVDIPVELDYQLAGIQYIDCQSSDWQSRLLAALGGKSTSQPLPDTGKLKNPFSSLPVLEPVERILILANRERELQKAVDQLKDHRLLLVTGMPGIGKSTFARALLEFMPPGSPPPFWYNFERQRSSGNSLSVLLDQISSYLDVCLDADVRREVMAFRNPPGGNPSVHEVDLLISFLNQEKPIWLVFDNLETVLSRDTYEFLDEGVELLFDSLKTSTHNAKIIITNPFVPILRTGEVFLEAGTSALILEGLNDDFTFAFLRAFGLQDRSKEELEPLIREINGHPFALNHIARYIQAVGSGVILADLPGGLEEINERFGDFLKGRLSAREFNALRSLTVLNRDVTVTGLCQIAQARPNVIMHLREKGLLQANQADKFWLHNIVRNSLKPTEPDALKQAHARAMHFFRQQGLPLSPQRIDDYASILEWHHHAVEAGSVIEAYSALYSTSLVDQLLDWNEYDLLVSLCEQTLSAWYKVEADISQVEASLSNMERIKLHHTLGSLYCLMGDYSKSIAQADSALQLLQFENDDELTVKLLLILAESYNGRREFKAAMDLCQKAEILLAKMKNDDLWAKFLHVRGFIYRDQGIQEQAVGDLEEALKIYKKLGDHVRIGSVTVELGISYYYQNQIEKAVASYQDAIVSYQAVNYVRGIMIARHNLGDIMLQTLDYESAIRELNLALSIGQKGKFGNLELSAGLGLAEAHVALLHLDEAQRILDSLKPLLSKTTSSCFLGQEIAVRAQIQLKSGNAARARELFQRAFRSLKDPGCQYEYARANLAYATCLQEQGQISKAKDSLLLARNIFAEQRNDLGLSAVDSALSSLSE